MPGTRDTSFAALPMYDWPEARDETTHEWTSIRDALQAEGIDAPEHLIRKNADLPSQQIEGHEKKSASTVSSLSGLPPQELDLETVWQHPQLLLAQTCWGPLEQGLASQVVIVGQPDYSRFEGGDGELYSSAILARSGERGDVAPSAVEALLPFLKGRRFAFNSTDSMSGILRLERDLILCNESLDLFSHKVETGGHRASIKAVAGGAADVCAIDCRTWDLAKRFEPAAEKVEVIGWTSKRKGLPYITSRHMGAADLEKIRKALSKLGT